MKKAADVLSILFDEQFIKKAQCYTNIFDTWAEITAKNGIAEAADHSRIKQLEKGILLVEMDHPGWKQILQTKKDDLLKDYQLRFPEMEIKSLSLILGKNPADFKNNSDQTQIMQNELSEEKKTETPEYLQSKEISFEVNESEIDYSSIKDEELRNKLIKLGQIIADREKGIS
ncbi:MAG: DUF721 domain-containing protein [Treponema sp.]|nr:DUF721 domain-containing protein [Treponema sp.]MCL2251803.1 DUF721 domain-containing protein [Treponema sp.]